MDDLDVILEFRLDIAIRMYAYFNGVFAGVSPMCDTRGECLEYLPELGEAWKKGKVYWPEDYGDE